MFGGWPCFEPSKSKILNMPKKGVLSFVMISKSENIKKAAVITESLKIPLFSIAIDGGTIQESNIGNFN